MKFGLMLNQQFGPEDDIGQGIRDLIRLTETARDLGFSSVLGLQHYVSSLATLQPIPLLARLAPHAGEMHVGTGVYIATLEHPVQLAENFATLDHLTGGRLILGVGAGYRRNEFTALGVDRSTRWSRLAETIELVKLLWSGEEVDHRGAHFTLQGERLRLTPVQQPHPPIWIGANAENTIRRAARIGADTWLAPPNVKMRWAKGHLEYFLDEMSTCRPDAAVPDRPIIRELFLADTDEAAVKQADDFVRNEYFTYAEYGIESWKQMYEDLRQKAFLFGSPETVGESLSDLAAGGFNEFIFRVSWSDMPVEMSIETLHRFAEEVMPQVATQD